MRNKNNVFVAHPTPLSKNDRLDYPPLTFNTYFQHIKGGT
jgi:hypothetical protein